MTMTYCAYLGCKAGPLFMVDPNGLKKPVCGRHLTGAVRDALPYGSPVEVIDFYAQFDGSGAKVSGVGGESDHESVDPSAPEQIDGRQRGDG